MAAPLITILILYAESTIAMALADSTNETTAEDVNELTLNILFGDYVFVTREQNLVSFKD